MLRKIHYCKTHFLEDNNEEIDEVSLDDSIFETCEFHQKNLDILGNRLEPSLTRLISLIGDSGENNVISPSTLLHALLVLAQMTGKKTREEILRLVGLDQEDAVTATALLWDSISADLLTSVCTNDRK